MGIGGHMLGARKLRQLNRMIPGYDFDRAYNRNGQGGARVIDEHGECLHYWVDFRTWEVELEERPIHWTSCPRRIIDLDKEYPAEERAKYEALFIECPPARVTGPGVLIRRKSEEA